MRKRNEKNSVFEGEEMRRKKYYLHTRNGIFHAELTNPVTGRKLTARSTGECNRDDALLVISDWLKNCTPSKSSAKKFHQKGIRKLNCKGIGESGLALNFLNLIS
jgi:hypothetical protein